MPNPKKGPHSGYFWREHPLFGPKSCVFEIALVSLVGVGTYEKILRPTQNPTLAGMDPLVSKYRYNHSHDADSIREVLQILATADVMRYRRKAKAPGELADIVSQGITRLQQLVQKQLEPPHYQ